MGDRSKIEWTDATWNPIRARHKVTGKVGWHCEKISPACTNCYAERQNKSGFAGGTRLPYVASSADQVEVFLDEEVLQKPLHWKRPRRIFVCSMTDLFGEWVPHEWQLRIYEVMDLASQHTFQVLTKRAERMRDFYWGESGAGASYDPIPNVWPGVTAENQEQWNERVGYLLDIPAVVRFVSAEPMLGPIDGNQGATCDIVLYGKRHYTRPLFHADVGEAKRTIGYKIEGGIDWLIVGGESGPGARPMHPAWVRSLRDQCQAAGVPFFFKQWGEWAPGGPLGCPFVGISGKLYMPPRCPYDLGAWMDSVKEPRAPIVRVGKKSAGRYLEDRTWDEFPQEVAHA